MGKMNEDSWGLEGLGLETQTTPTLVPEPSGYGFAKSTSEEPDIFSDLSSGEEVYIPLESQEPENLPSLREPLSPWPPKLPLDLALGDEDEANILLRNNISTQQYQLFKTLPAFRRELAAAQRYIRENGLDFKAKCGRMAQEFLEDIYLNFFNERVGLNTKHDIFKTVTRLAELEPKEEKGQNSNVQAVQININL